MSSVRIKYPRTFHLPWSEGRTSDDKVWTKDILVGREVVVTEKFDGENTTIYPDGTCHARSLSSSAHPSRDYVRALAARVGYKLPSSYRVCGENLYAQHSLAYKDLEDYFLVFSVWEGDVCLSWEETVLWASELGLKTVSVLYQGAWPVDPKSFWKGPEVSEGYVVRDAGSFAMDEFTTKVAKYVRKGHVQTGDHWMHQEVRPNSVRSPQ